MRRFSALRSIHLILLSALILSAVSCGKSETPKLSLGNASTPFQVGQVWTYKSRMGEERSNIIICKLEEDPKAGRLVHLAIMGLKLRNFRSPTGTTDRISHMPFDEAAVRASVMEIVGTTSDLPPYESGYNEWRQAFNSGNGGVWRVPIAQAVAEMEIMFTQVNVAPSTTTLTTMPN